VHLTRRSFLRTSPDKKIEMKAGSTTDVRYQEYRAPKLEMGCDP
jgi:hypothetical protein